MKTRMAPQALVRCVLGVALVSLIGLSGTAARAQEGEHAPAAAVAPEPGHVEPGHAEAAHGEQAPAEPAHVAHDNEPEPGQHHEAPPKFEMAPEALAPHGGEHGNAGHGGEHGAAGHGGGHHGKRDVSDVIFSHVANAPELEFENPLTGDETLIHLPEMKAAFGISWLDLSLSKHLVFLWIGAAFVVLLFALFRPRTTTPSGLGLALEMLVLFIRDDVAKPTIGEDEYKTYTPYLLTCFFFILVCNLIGLVPFTATATANIAVTAGLAICTFVVTQFASIRAAGIAGYLGHLTGGVHPALWPIMIPVEILGLFTKPFALTMRLFANMLAGHIVIYYLLALIFLLGAFMAPVSVALAAAIYLLELFVAFLQAYVFTMLSSLFIGMGVAMGHHAHHDDGHAAEHHAHGAH